MKLVVVIHSLARGGAERVTVNLANHLAAEGKGLHAGQLVLTGSLVKTLWLKAGDKVRMELDGLGTVEVEFT